MKNLFKQIIKLENLLPMIVFLFLGIMALIDTLSTDPQLWWVALVCFLMALVVIPLFVHYSSKNKDV